MSLKTFTPAALEISGILGVPCLPRALRGVPGQFLVTYRSTHPACTTTLPHVKSYACKLSIMIMTAIKVMIIMIMITMMMTIIIITNYDITNLFKVALINTGKMLNRNT